MEVDKKKVWIFHPTATPLSTNGMHRAYNFSKKMSEKYDTNIFTSSYLHYARINIINDGRKSLIQIHEGVKFTFLKTSSYNSNRMILRILNMIFYFFRLLSLRRKKQYIKHKKPDLIYASSPYPLTLVAGVLVARRFEIPCICEVRDLWPEAIFAFGKAKESSLLGKILIAGEKWIYKNSDALIFLKEGDTDYLRERKWLASQGGPIDIGKCYYINNGVDNEAFDCAMKNEVLFDDEEVISDKFKVIYAGSLRAVNNVGGILDAAKLLTTHSEIVFLIYGEGNEIDLLKRRVVEEKIENVKIQGYIDKKNVPFVLSNASINLLNYAQSKYNWTRGNSSNKLFDYMASGKPIISTVQMGYCLLEKYNCGLTLEEDTPQHLANKVLEIYTMSSSGRELMGENAKRAAYDFDYEVLASKLMTVIEQLLN